MDALGWIGNNTSGLLKNPSGMGQCENINFTVNNVWLWLRESPEYECASGSGLSWVYMGVYARVYV
eukprot:m.22436 g.22436  ORF g.22436 m.22436 type:complete len:66 (-) comp13813_c0_seq1:114-311(-)